MTCYVSNGTLNSSLAIADQHAYLLTELRADGGPKSPAPLRTHFAAAPRRHFAAAAAAAASVTDQLQLAAVELATRRRSFY